jgi:hypothetical protein
VNAIGKKYGAKVEGVAMDMPHAGRSVAELDADMKETREYGFEAVQDPDERERYIQSRIAELQRQRDIAQALEAAGGLEQPAVTITPELATAVSGGQALFQAARDDRRGSLRFGPDRQFTLSLFAKADLSTFLHESGHFFLEVFGDTVDRLRALDPATLVDTQRRLISDYDGLLAHLGVASRGELGTAQHETFARTFEAYLMTGQAPSLALRSTFATFRSWLVGIYKSLRGLNVELSPAITGVLDRLLATDQAIAEAEAEGAYTPLFTDARSAGMSDAQFALYRETVAQASTRAQEILQTKLLAEVERVKTARWHEEREAIRTTVEAELHRSPVYVALSAIRSGTAPNGTSLTEGDPEPMPLSRQAIVDEFGAGRLKTLPRPYVYRSAGGLTPSQAAELFGFSSGDALLTAIAAAPPLATAIKDETDRRMTAAHPSMLLDGTLHEKALAALANDSRGAVIRAEMKALAELRRTVAPHEALVQQRADQAHAYETRWLDAERKLTQAIAAGKHASEIDALEDEVANLKRKARGGPAVIAGAIPPVSLIEAAAVDRIAGLRIADIKPALYWSAARRASQSAIDNAARQDFDAAITAQQQQLLNLALYRHATDALADVEQRVAAAKALGTPAARKRLGLRDAADLAQVDGVLDRYQFTEVSGKALARRISLRAWADAKAKAGFAIDLPDEVLDDARRVHYKELTYDELVGVTDGLAQIVHVSRQKNTLAKMQDLADFTAARDRLLASILAHTKATKAPLEFRGVDLARQKVAMGFAAHRKIALLARAMDGHEDGGPMWALVNVLNNAANAQQERNKVEGKAYFAILERYYPGRQLGLLKQKVYIPGIDGSLSLEGRLAVALNYGSQQGRDRLTNDPTRKWSAAGVRAVLETLTKRDWDFVQATWDFNDRFWPEIAAKQERVVGVAPDRVIPLEVDTKFGPYRGGYYHLAYDPDLNPGAAGHETIAAATLNMAAGYVRATTRRGHTKARVDGVQLSVKLNLSVEFAHIAEVIHDLTHHEALRDVTRLLRDPKIARAIYETRGPAVYRQFTTALEDIARGTNVTQNFIDKAATWMRTGTQVAALGWSFWTTFAAAARAVQRHEPRRREGWRRGRREVCDPRPRALAQRRRDDAAYRRVDYREVAPDEASHRHRHAGPRRSPNRAQAAGRLVRYARAHGEPRHPHAAGDPR